MEYVPNGNFPVTLFGYNGVVHTRSFVLGLACLFLAACAQPTALPTATTVTASATVTPTAKPSVTPNPTFTATATAQPTATPWPTATPFMPPPTYTPAVPEGANYQLQQWTDKEADELINQVRSYLTAIGEDPLYGGVYGYSIYQNQHGYAVFAETEAISRFPNSSLVQSWRWWKARDEAIAYPYSERAQAPELETYGLLIVEALNTGQITVEELPQWFFAHTPELGEPKFASAPVPDGYETSYILNAGVGAHWWLLEKDGQFAVYSLLSNLYYFREAYGDFEQADLTGDGYAELILTYSTDHCCGFSTAHYIYDLTAAPPKLITQLGSISESEIGPNSKLPGFVFDSTLVDSYFTWCVIEQTEIYRWNGEKFQRETAETYVSKDDWYKDWPVCKFLKNTPMTSEELEFLADFVRDASAPSISAERKIDELRYRLALYRALSDRPIQAIETFNDLIANPAVITSTMGFEQKFLELYQSPEDLYRACAAVPLCDTHAAIEQLTSQIEPAAYSLALERLQALGVPVLASGYFDFEQDGQAEQWFTTRPNPKAKTELWLLVHTPEAIQALFVTNVVTSRPTFALLFNKTFQIDEKSFETGRSETTGELVIREVFKISDTSVNVAAQTIAQAQKDLFAGADPALIITILRKAQQDKDFDCKQLDCAHFQYLLGLAYELAQDEGGAIESYLKLWRDYPESPYTIMARSKLEPSP